MTSLHVRVTLGVLLGQLALLAAGTWVAHRKGSEVLTAQFDQTLAAKVATFESLVEQEGDFIGVEHVDGLLPEYERDEDPEYFQVALEDGLALFRGVMMGNLGCVEHELGTRWGES